MKKIIIAIDGPAGSGKTSSAKLIAERLNYVYIDTGAMYRAVTLAWLNTNEGLTNDILIEIMNNISINLKPSSNGQITLLNGIDVSEDIRTTKVNKFVSQVSANENVRTKLVNLQRKLGESKCCVMDGRDIGTVVFPDAELKIFLTATIGNRAKRRLLEYQQKGLTDLSFDEIAEQITARDKYDSSRDVSPLCKAESAIEIDTSNLTLDEQVEKIYNLAVDVING